MTPTGPGQAAAPRRRWRSAVPRPHRLGPLMLSDDEQADIRAAAQRSGLSPGAAARHDLPATPFAARDQIVELLQARLQLARIAALLPNAHAVEVLPELTRASRRLEHAANTLVRHAFRTADPK
ncbi:hypothetical protein [Sinosporangium siamense]|uniref:Uncharacterized protein n=1 Tax=Sinosporangium siamense TaxID=1367973 RepID=A0A919RM69_9ACTN|nr:hypothetical protein [Sinosporangium siamense]GII96352.1 hypothetical protein Ssi02_65830 [Sinosporangium siamense]